MAAAAELDEVVITAELGTRPPRAPNLPAESGALHAIGTKLLRAPREVLQTLLDACVDICGAGTAGVSLLEPAPDGGEHFRWVALSGKLASEVGGTLPRKGSPCGTCLDRGKPQLYRHPARFFTQLERAEIVEALVVPFRAGEGRDLGTVWIVSHDQSRGFDAEDARLLTSLAGFTAVPFTLLSLAEERERLDQRKGELLATLGHELRNPLAAIASAVRLVEAQGSAPAHVLDVLQRHTTAMRRVVDELLDLSRLERGTEVPRFPLRRAEEGASPSEAPHSPFTSRRRLRVLVVDDNVDAATLTGELVTLFGHETLVVHDASAALEAAATPWDLVLLDLGLPDMEGHDVSRRLRDGPSRGARIVVVSGYGLPSDVKRSQAAGCDEHVVKPLGFRELEGILARVAEQNPEA